MEQYCPTCKRSFGDEPSCCPECGAALAPRTTGESRNGYKPDATPLPNQLQASAADCEPAHSEHEIDLGKPVSASQSGAGGPPSGASFVSWSERLEQKKRPAASPGSSGPEPAVQFDPPSAARLRLDQGRLLPCPDSTAGSEPAQAPVPDEPHGEAEIDLGKPVTEPKGDSGPLSGASGVGWAALLRARKKYEDPNHPTLDYHNPEPGASPRGAGPQLAVSQPRSSVAPAAPLQSSGAGLQLRSVALGFLLGVGACGTFWWFGYEPPQSWRHRPAPNLPVPRTPAGEAPNAP